jgi:L-rhamnose mutarotase
VKRFCLACDLKNDPELIAEYRKWHQPGGVWPEIINSIKEAGVLDMEIYLFGTRMVLIMETTEDFTLEHKATLDRNNPRVVEWENLMWRFQEAVPGVPEDQKWSPMERIFKLP